MNSLPGVDVRFGEVCNALDVLNTSYGPYGLIKRSTGEPLQNYTDITFSTIEYIQLVSYCNPLSKPAIDRRPYKDWNEQQTLSELGRDYGRVSPYAVSALFLRQSVRFIGEKLWADTDIDQPYTDKNGLTKHVGGADATGYMVMGNMIEAAANAMVKSPEPTLETLTAAAEAGLGSIAVPFALVANNPNRKLERLYELRNSTVVDKAYTAYEIGVDETKKYCIGIDKAGRPAPVFWQETMLAATVGASDARCSAVGSRMFGMIWDRQVQTAARMPELFKATLQTR